MKDSYNCDSALTEIKVGCCSVGFLPVVKCLRQGGWGGGRRGQAGRIRMVRRLLQRLDQVVSVLRIYGPQGAFAYALREGTEEGSGEETH